MLLTEAEVAERLRCAKSKVKRLRVTGALTYIPGRPPLIDEQDLIAFISKSKTGQRQITLPDGRIVTEVPATKTAAESAAERARLVWLQRKMRAKRGGK
jgi:hypothetical protein